MNNLEIDPDKLAAESEVLDKLEGHLSEFYEPGDDPRGRRYNFDHVVLLRRGPSNAPTQWALLSQPYGPQNPGGRAKMLGPAPYGNGTHALLYEGVSL